MTTDKTITCPNCSRQVEAGFKFCDYCGTKLDDIAAPEPASTREPKKSFRERRRERREQQKPEQEKAEQEKSGETASLPIVPVVPSGLERPEKTPDKKPIDIDPPPPKIEAPAASAAPTPAPTPPPARIASKPMTVEEMREKGVGIAGRLRWREGEVPPGPEDTDPKTVPVPAPPPSVTWRPAADATPKTSRGRFAGLFVLHLLIAFVAGALLLAIAAVVASMTSNGRVALLEVRGLPIFIAGAVAIIAFSLLRTGPRPGVSRVAVIGSIAVGFLILVAAVAFSYQPTLMAEAQQRLDRSLGVFGSDLQDAVTQYTGDVDQWNAEVDNYRLETLRPYLAALDKETDAAKLDRARQTFSVDASASEEALDGIYKRMQSHADQIEHAPLRDATRDLVAVFESELSAIRLITRGTVTGDQSLTAAGDARFKDATVRVVEVFDERVLPILERAEIDPNPLEQSLLELRGSA